MRMHCLPKTSTNNSTPIMNFMWWGHDKVVEHYIVLNQLSTATDEPLARLHDFF